MRTYSSLLAAMIALLTVPMYGCDAAKEAANDVAKRAKDAVGSDEPDTAAAAASADTAADSVPAPIPPVKKEIDPQQLADAFMKLAPRDINDNQIMKIAAVEAARDLITEIRLTSATLTPASLDTLATFPNLKKLDMSGAGRSPNTYSFLAKLPNLEVLDLNTTQFNDASMSFIAGMTGLRELVISDTAVSDQGLVHLKNMPNLEVLRMRKVLTNGASFKFIPCQNLRVLEVGRTRFSVEGWRFMKKMPKLEVFRAGECGFDDKTIKGIRGCSNLVELYLGKNQITDDGLKSLRGFSKLQKLSLAQNRRVSGKGLIVMKSLKQVIMLDINGTMTNQQSVKELVQLLPDADIMYDGRTY